MVRGTETEQIPHVSIDMEECIALTDSLKHEVASLPPLLDERCIFRVPERVRESNKQAYMPRVVSIGPFHREEKSLKPMEKHKIRYLGDFLERTEVPLEKFIKLVKENEQRLRSCYAEDIDLNSNEFVTLILVDAVFIIEFLSRYPLEQWKPDHIHGPPKMLWDIRYDLCMLENQLPFFILEDLFGLAGISESFYKYQPISLTKLIIYYGKLDWDFLAIEDDLEDSISGYETKHIVDLLRSYLLPSQFPYKGEIKSLTIPSATELHRAGVKLRLGESKNLFDMRFDKEKGVLEIPHLRIVSSTELILRNIVVYELCLQEEVYSVADYCTFMNYLANSAEDVELLVQSGIIDNWLEDGSDVSNIFKNIGQHALVDYRNFHFAALAESLNEYCSRPWHEWMANLKQNYFNNPWAAISVIAAAFLLILTIIQTVCSILQVV